MLYQLNDTSGESLGLVQSSILNPSPEAHRKAEEEIEESWHDFHSLEEHELDPNDVDEFVTWHNENWETQIERVFINEIYP